MNLMYFLKINALDRISLFSIFVFSFNKQIKKLLYRIMTIYIYYYKSFNVFEINKYQINDFY